MYDLTFAFLLLAARKRASWIWETQLIAEFIPIQLFLYVILNLSRVFAYCIYIKATAPKLTAAIFKFKIAELLIEHQATFAF